MLYFLSPPEEYHLKKHPKDWDPLVLKEALKRIKEIPSEIEAISSKATANDCKDRYLTVEDLVKDIEKYLQNRIISAKEYSLHEILWKTLKRHKILILFLLTILSLGFLSFYLQKRSATYERNFALGQKYQEYLKNWKKAESQKVQAEQIKLLDLSAKKQSLEYWLQALKYLHIAQSFPFEETKIQDEKQKAGKQAVLLACETANYQLAYHIAGDLHEMESYIQSAEEKELKDDLFRFEEGIKQLRSTKLLPGDREEILLEISKMQHPEIFQKLLQFLEEGTAYFIHSTQRKVIEDEFYITLAKALGWFGNPLARDPLLNALTQMTDALKTLPFNERPQIKMDYMITLTEALRISKALDCAKKLDQLRIEMGEGEYFSQNTQKTFKLLILREALHLVPAKTAEEYFDRGYFQYRLNNETASIHDFIKASEIRPQWAEAHYYQGLLSLQQWIKNKQETDLLEKGLSSTSQTIKILSHSKTGDSLSLLNKAYLKRAQIQTHRKEYHCSIEDYNNALELNSKDYKAYRDRAVAKGALGEYAEALLDFNKAIELNPTDSSIYNFRGILKQKFAKETEALLDFNNAIELNPLNPDFYYNRGLLLSKQKNKKAFSEAILNYTSALQLDPQYEDAYKKRGDVYLQLQNEEEALLNYNHVLLLNPKNIQASLERAKIKRNQKKFQSALEDYHQAILHNTSKTLESALYNNRGEMYKELHQMKEAYQDFYKAIELNPQLHQAYFNLACMYQLENKMFLTLYYFEKGLSFERNLQILDCFKLLLLKYIKEIYSQNQMALLFKQIERFQRCFPSYTVFQVLSEAFKK